jgi:hypothetical protein
MILTRVFAALLEDAEAIGDNEKSCSDRESVDVDGLEQVRLATLLCIVCDEDWEDDVLDEFESLHAVSPQGPWVFLIPSRMARALAYLKDGRAAKVVEEWTQTEDFQRDTELKVSPETFAENCLLELRSIARVAKEDDLQMLLRISL